jgi:hypothetical protein
MSQYLYTGPDSAVTLRVVDGKGLLEDRDVMLWHGKAVELPPNHELVAVLVARGHLAPVPAAPQEIDPPAASADAAESKTAKPGKAK